VGTLVSFRVGAEDAEHLEKEFEPVFMQNDIVNLAKYQVYLKLMIDGIAGDAFSATSLPPIDLSATAENEEKAIKVSRERYGRSRAEIEEKIARWSGMFDFDEFEEEASPNKKNKIIQAKKEDAKPKNYPPLQDKKISPVKDTIQTPQSDVETNVNSRPIPEVAQEKQMYEAVCTTCEEKIRVPFKPDASRPTFCKECLKDYQRARARVQKDNVEKRQFQPEKTIRNYEPEKRIYEPVSHNIKDKPMSLNQMQHIAPKKFKPAKKNIPVDLDGVRDLINKTRHDKK
jgi:CxxC-x17-CxxC domain-containing protein